MSEYDIFISHASEDKDAVARPLCKALLEKKYNVFLDEICIKLGDSISESINKGLSQANYGIIIISPTFLSKNWTIAELQTITNLYISKKIEILPILHNISHTEIENRIPLLVDIKSIDTNSGMDLIVTAIIDKVGQATSKTNYNTNYLWNFYDFSPHIQKSILNNISLMYNDVDLVNYHSALEEVDLFLSTIDPNKLSSELREIFLETKKRINDAIIEDIHDLLRNT